MTKHPTSQRSQVGSPKSGARQKVYTLKLSQKTQIFQNNQVVKPNEHNKY